MPTYKLTEEGEYYLKHGLPEKNLVELLKNGPVSIKEAENKIKNFNIALLWAKRNGWIDLKFDNLVLVKYPERFREQEALESIAKGEEVSQELIDILIQRKLVEKVKSELEEVKKLVGKEVLHVTKELIKTGIWRQVKFKRYDVTVAGEKIYGGKRHPYVQFLNEVRKKLVELGFKEVRGQAIVTEFWNFDALFQPQNHSSRDWTQTYTLKFPKYGKLSNSLIVKRVKATHENGWETGSKGWGYKWDIKKAMQLMPVAHDTAFSPMMLCSKELEIPGKYFQIVRCYRPDVIDAKHGVEFTQMGGFIIDENLNFRHLLGLLKQFVEELIGKYEVKFSTAYFPFTEPSCEILVKHPELGWIECAGAGIFRPEVTEPLGVKLPVLAWGFGIDRLAMIKLGINDIRELFSRNLKWLRDSEICLQ
jgi:phenylalanyl-tRNA synthetase alpha chain